MTAKPLLHKLVTDDQTLKREKQPENMIIYHKCILKLGDTALLALSVTQ